MPPRLRENVLRMTPYSPGRPIHEVQREHGLTDVVKLASNENPLGASPKAMEAVRGAISQMHVYPDASSAELKQALSMRHGLPEEQILVGNGSDELIHYLGLVFLERGDEVIVGDPSFVRYNAAAEQAGARLIRVPLDGSDRHDLDAMLSAVTNRTKLLWLANPNNPTGTIVLKDAVLSLLKRTPDGTAVILDEAYFEFVDDVEYPDSADFLRQGISVIGLRTFSKTYGLAGLRVGYGFAPREVVDAIECVREPFNVNVLAQKAAVAALEDTEHLARSLQCNKQGLERLSTLLSKQGARVAESFANFVWADFGRPAEPICDALLRKGVIVRSGSMFGRPNCIRVSVGTSSELDRFENALEEVLRGNEVA